VDKNNGDFLDGFQAIGPFLFSRGAMQIEEAYARRMAIIEPDGTIRLNINQGDCPVFVVQVGPVEHEFDTMCRAAVARKSAKLWWCPLILTDGRQWWWAVHKNDTSSWKPRFFLGDLKIIRAEIASYSESLEN
jgi:hypothetical protein